MTCAACVYTDNGWCACECHTAVPGEFIDGALKAVLADHDSALTARLTAFARTCVLEGDMSPTAERMLLRILKGDN